MWKNQRGYWRYDLSRAFTDWRPIFKLFDGKWSENNGDAVILPLGSFVRSRPTKINNFNHFENMNSLPPLQSNWVENGPEIFEEFVISTPGSIDSNPFNSPIHSFRLYFGQKSSKLVKNGPVLSLFHLVKPNRFWKDQSVEPISTNWTHFVVGLNKSDQLKCAGSSNNGSTLLSKAISSSILQNAFIYWPER